MLFACGQFWDPLHVINCVEKHFNDENCLHQADGNAHLAASLVYFVLLGSIFHSKNKIRFN